MTVYVCICQFVYILYPPVYLPTGLSIYLSFYLHTYLSICVLFCVCNGYLCRVKEGKL